MCFLFTGSSAAGQSWSTLRNCSNTVSLCAELGNRLLCATFAHASTVSPLIQSIIQSPVWGRKTFPCCLGGGPSTQIIWVEVDTCAAGNNSTLDEEGLPTHWNVKFFNATFFRGLCLMKFQSAESHLFGFYFFPLKHTWHELQAPQCHSSSPLFCLPVDGMLSFEGQK